LAKFTLRDSPLLFIFVGCIS